MFQFSKTFDLLNFSRGAGKNIKKGIYAKFLFFIATISFLFCAQAYSQQLTLDSLQRRHTELRFGMFMHFNMNTYYPDWGNARVDPKLFNPKNLDCAQWASTAKAAGMTYALLTAKHHDGFTIWPSKQVAPNGKIAYTIAESSTPTKDVVMEYVTEFRKAGLQPGLYYSMWDVANGVDNNWAQSKKFVMGQLTELLGGYYGEIPILVIDGWAWKMGHKAIPYQEIRDTVKKMQPNCLLTDHNGLMSPWEEDIFYVEEPKNLYCQPGNTFAACQGATISGNWFWDANANNSSKLMSLSNILSHLNNLEPRYCNFLLNCPPNQKGVFDQVIVDRLKEVGTSWKANATRAPLPKQMTNIENPISPIAATASSGNADNAIDGKSDCLSSSAQAYCSNPLQTFWTSTGKPPQYVTLDFGRPVSNIGILGYLPNQTSNDGMITGYTVSTSTDNATFTNVANGTWPVNRSYRTVTFTPVTARYVRLTATATSNASGGTGGTIAVVSEINVGQTLGNTGISRIHEFTSDNQYFSAKSTYTVMSDRFVLPIAYKNKAVKLSLYDISGKLMRIIATKTDIIDLKKTLGVSNKTCIVRIALQR